MHPSTPTPSAPACVPTAAAPSCASLRVRRAAVEAGARVEVGEGAEEGVGHAAVGLRVALGIVLVDDDALVARVAAALGRHRRAARARALLAVRRARRVRRVAADLPVGAPLDARVVRGAAGGRGLGVVARALAQSVVGRARLGRHALGIVLVDDHAGRRRLAARERIEGATAALRLVLGARRGRRRGRRGRRRRHGGVLARRIPLVGRDALEASVAARNLLHHRVALAGALAVLGGARWLGHALGVVLVDRLARVRSVAAGGAASALGAGVGARGERHGGLPDGRFAWAPVSRTRSIRVGTFACV
mmetsp:Transcript_10324/g.25574  ORF Transcript_10324/g.25574 Transcript_10324/m.25574 type:complete len:306 (-) Transcript_10324:129-1046(-)